MEIIGYGMTKVCAENAFRAAGFAEGEGRDQVGVVELHDCFAANELLAYAALGLCPPAEAHRLVERGDNTVQSFFVVKSLSLMDILISMVANTLSIQAVDLKPRDIH